MRRVPASESLQADLGMRDELDSRHAALGRTLLRSVRNAEYSSSGSVAEADQHPMTSASSYRVLQFGHLSRGQGIRAEPYSADPAAGVRKFFAKA